MTLRGYAAGEHVSAGVAAHPKLALGSASTASRPSRVSEFLSGKRELSKSQVEGLRRVLGIPADVLLGLSGK